VSARRGRGALQAKAAVLLFAPVLLAAQTTVNLRSAGTGFYVTGASNATPIVLTTGAAHGLSAGDLISLDGVIFDSGPGCGSGGMLSGEYKVKAVVDTTHFSVMSTGAVDTQARGTWCDGSFAGSPGGAQWGGKLAPFTLTAGIRGWFDGDNGKITRQIALGNWNGLVSLTVFGDVATLVTPDNYFRAFGTKIGVWGSGSTVLDNGGKPYTVSIDDPTHAHFSTSGVPNGTYSGANMACGPSGHDDCLRISQWAYTGNVAWEAVVSTSSTFASRRCTYDAAEGGGYSYISACTGHINDGALSPQTFASLAMHFFVVQTSAEDKASLIYWITHVERFMGVNFSANESVSQGGAQGWVDFASYWFRDLAIMYPIIKPYLTTQQQQDFRDKTLDDITDPAPCSKVLGIQPGGSATFSAGHIIGSGTHFTTDVAVGDAIYFRWDNGDFPEYFVSAINSDTDITAITADGSTVSTGYAYYVVHKWKRGDCGGLWLKRHWAGSYGSHPILYPPNGGFSTNNPFAPTHSPSLGGNNGYTMTSGLTVFGLALADEDPRAIRLLQQSVSFHWDYMLPLAMGYRTGFDRSGAFYSFGRTMTDSVDWAVWMKNGVIGYADLGTTGPWVTAPAMMKIYAPYPYPTNNGDAPPREPIAAVWPARWGAEDGNNSADASNVPEVWSVYMRDTSWVLAPNSDEAAYMRSFYLSHGDGHIYSQYAARDFFRLGPAQFQASRDFTALPTQYLFQATSQTACAALGLNCPANVRGDGVISRSGWSSPSDSHVMFQARTFFSDHDSPQAGVLDIYKTGFLLQNFAAPPGATQQSDFAHLNDTTGLIDIGAGNHYYGGLDNADLPGYASMDRFSGAKPFGDAQSRYMYAMANVAGLYTVPVHRANRHVVHFKKPGTEEVVVMYDDIDVSDSPTSIRANLHYPQNGERQNAYLPPEGQTTCPGTGGCAALDTSRLILEQEDGVGARHSGLITRIFSPGVITVRWDGSSYPGSAGSSNRVSICAGASCGATVWSADYVVVHKVTPTLSDTALTAIALNPDASWTGVQTTDKVALFARGGVTRIAIDFTTTHQGSAQYLIAGLEGGHIYQVHRNDDSTDVAFVRVTDGDNTVYFEAPAGSYSIFPSNLSKLFLGRQPPTRRGRAVRIDFKNPTDPGSYIWSVTAGNLPPGLRLSANGVLSGTPSQEGEFAVTVQAAEAASGGAIGAASVTLDVLPAELQLRILGATASGGVLLYTLPGSPAEQRCDITVSANADLTSPAETFTDTGGGAARVAVLGRFGALAGGGPFYVRAQCGAVAATASFVAASAGFSQGLTIRMTPPSGRGVVAAQAEYGPSPALGSVSGALCAAVCSLNIPLGFGRLLYVRRSFLDASGHVVARSGVAPYVSP